MFGNPSNLGMIEHRAAVDTCYVPWPPTSSAKDWLRADPHGVAQGMESGRFFV
jgi:hypothetical protein